MGAGAIIGGLGSMWAANKSAKAQQKAAESGAAAALEQTKMGIEAQKEMQQKGMDYSDSMLQLSYGAQMPYYTTGTKALANLSYIITGREPDENMLRDMYGVNTIEERINLLERSNYSNKNDTSVEGLAKKRDIREQINDLEHKKQIALNSMNDYKPVDFKESESYKWQKQQGENQTQAYMQKMGFAGSRMEANAMRDFYSELNAKEQQQQIQRLGGLVQYGQHSADIISQAGQGNAGAITNMISFGQQPSANMYMNSADAAMQGAAAKGAAQAGLYNSYSNLFAGMFNRGVNQSLVPDLPHYKQYQSEFRAPI